MSVAAVANPFAPIAGVTPTIKANGHDVEWVPIVPVPADASRIMPAHQLGKPSRRWVYKDAAGKSLMVICRFDHDGGGKQFRPLTYCRGPGGKPEWHWVGLPTPRPLYGLDKLASRPSAPVLVNEGEKSADAAAEWFPDHVCITSPGGVGGAKYADWSPVTGRAVVIWRDNDEPGKVYARDVARMATLAGAKSVNIVTLPSDLPEGWDLADEFPEGVTPDKIREMLSNAVPAPFDRADTKISTAIDIDLSPLRHGRAKPPALPIDLLGSWADWINQAAEAANAPSDYVVAALLAAASGAIGNARWAEAWEGWSEPPALWIAAVGDPSSGKSPSADLVFAGLRRIEAEELQAFEPIKQQQEAKREFAEAAAAQWKDSIKSAVKQGQTPPPMPDAAIVPEDLSPPRLLIQDTTPEALAGILRTNERGILSTRDELSGWLGGMDRYNAGGERAFWIEAYGGRPFRVDRKGSKSFSIPRLLCSVFGGVQPDKFASLVAGGDDDGLAARFLWIWPEPRPFARPKRAADANRIFEAVKRLRSLPMIEGEHGPQPFYVRCTDEAAALLEEWCAEQLGVTHHGGNLLRSWRGKGRGHILRLALVLEFLEWAFFGDTPPPASIGNAAMARAVALYAEYLVPMAQRVFGDAALPEPERDAGAIAQFIVATKLDAVNVRDIYRKRVGGITDAPRAHRAVDVLVDAGWIFDASTREGATSGRKRGDYQINPSLWGAIRDGENG
jgi:putative DNA primase/helicase